ncbi:hypothetical protein BGX26_011705 [Mortierella sp. AD094]|nr:hypothetical protein BGX26_011705 [Mortierella sp. AD094]
MSQHTPEAKTRPDVLIIGAGIAGLTRHPFRTNQHPLSHFRACCRSEASCSGYESLIFCRSRLYEILLRRVPPHKISFKKKVLRTEEKEGKVHIHCSDNTSYAGDILVGADGAYSGVRQSMYKCMEENGILPKSDLEEFSIGYTTIVGVATPSDPEKYPQLKDECTSFNQVLFGDGANCYIAPLPDNQIGWGLDYSSQEKS